ncbi:MAG: hypothetical protein CMO61_02135 [Verrucomicrobiales bacterium]|nr:hypothetical protein [Verrucomicrobiales bacterium]|tara:strand:+ start:48816 stop:49007 length:192 start_codon:yes stop_codon:yes gene_type:complete
MALPKKTKAGGAAVGKEFSKIPIGTAVKRHKLSVFLLKGMKIQLIVGTVLGAIRVALVLLFGE